MWVIACRNIADKHNEILNTVSKNATFLINYPIQLNLHVNLTF